VAAPLVVGLLAPSAIIFCLEVFVGHIGPFAALIDILQRQFGGGHNLFLLALFGLIPFAVLSAVCLVASRYLSPVRLSCLGGGGLLGILCFMVPTHVAVWYPLYGGGHMSSTAVIAFLFIPFYCLVPLFIGLLTGWAVSLLPFARHAHNDQVA
jgi:hypothetical protein